MASELSPQSEAYLAQVVAGGVYPSKEAALDAAVDALREKNSEIPLVPEEHDGLIEQAIASSKDGRSRPMTDDDWARLRKLATDAAAAKGRGES
jgi:hypothetical protein